MHTSCNCAVSRYLCPLHSNNPYSTPGKRRPQTEASLATTSRTGDPVDLKINALSQSDVQPTQSSDSNKRPAVNTGLYPPRKRQKGTDASAVSQDDQVAKQVKISKQAAASIPAAYHVDDHFEAVRRMRSAKAIDCWYLTAGTDTAMRPSAEEMQTLRLSDQARIEKLDTGLMKPSTSHLRCIECLKFDKWTVWKNNSKGGVSFPIRRHLRKEHRAAYYSACKRVGYDPTDLQDGPDEEDIQEPITAEGVLRYIVEWFTADDISFNMVSHRGFRRFFSYISQGKLTSKDIPDRHTVAEMAEKLSAEAKERIKKEINDASGRISCTSDLWSDDAQRSFMCITAHFYNRQKQMVNRLIAFRVIEGSHKGDRLAETFFEAIDEYGIVSKLGMITLDNAGNNDTFMASLEEYMTARGMNFDRHENRLRCFPHVVNLAVQDILGALADSAAAFQKAEESKGEVLTDEVAAYLAALATSPQDRIRRTAVALRYGQRRQGLQNAIAEGNKNGLFHQPKLVEGNWFTEEFQMKQLQLILDCPTRWSSTFNMIARFLYLYPAVSRYIASVPALAGYAITHKDFEVLYDIKTVLSLAHRVQELLSSDKTPTLSHTLPLYHALVDQWRQLQLALPALSHAIGAGIDKIETYIAKVRLSPAYVVAMALNPSIRYQWLDQNLPPKEAANARLVMKSYMLRCLEDQQRIQRESPESIESSPAKSLRAPSKADTAATRLNRGYESVLTAGVDIRPSSSIFSSYSSSASTVNSVSLHSTVAVPQPQTAEQIAELNTATVELEHQKFEQLAVATPQEMEGISSLDYWMAQASDMPLIFKVALNTLPAQASSVSSERVFSSSKFTCTQYRNQISAPRVEALQILKHALRHQPTQPELLDLMAHHIDRAWGDTTITSTD